MCISIHTYIVIYIYMYIVYNYAILHYISLYCVHSVILGTNERGKCGSGATGGCTSLRDSTYNSGFWTVV